MEACSWKAEALAFLVPPEELEARRGRRGGGCPGDQTETDFGWPCGGGGSGLKNLKEERLPPLLHFCSEASPNISEPAFLSIKHFPFSHFFSSNVGYSMLASCFTSPSLGSHSVFGGQRCSEVLVRTPEERKVQTAASDSGRSTLSNISGVGLGLCYALGLGPISMATSYWMEEEGQGG